MIEECEYRWNADENVLEYRIPGHRHGSGQVDSEEQPVWLLADPETDKADYHIVPMDEDPVRFIGTLDEAIEEAKDRDADVFLHDACVWINSWIVPGTLAAQFISRHDANILSMLNDAGNGPEDVDQDWEHEQTRITFEDSVLVISGNQYWCE